MRWTPEQKHHFPVSTESSQISAESMASLSHQNRDRRGARHQIPTNLYCKIPGLSPFRACGLVDTSEALEMKFIFKKDNEAEYQKGIQREISSMNRLDHPHIVNLRGSFTHLGKSLFTRSIK